MPSMPGSGTWVPLDVLEVAPPVLVEVDDEVDDDEEVELEVLDDELVLPVQNHLQPPDEPPYQVAEAGAAPKAAEAKASAIMDFLNMTIPRDGKNRRLSTNTGRIPQRPCQWRNSAFCMVSGGGAHRLLSRIPTFRRWAN